MRRLVVTLATLILTFTTAASAFASPYISIEHPPLTQPLQNDGIGYWAPIQSVYVEITGIPEGRSITTLQWTLAEYGTTTPLFAAPFIGNWSQNGTTASNTLGGETGYLNYSVFNNKVHDVSMWYNAEATNAWYIGPTMSWQVTYDNGSHDQVTFGSVPNPPTSDHYDPSPCPPGTRNAAIFGTALDTLTSFTLLNLRTNTLYEITPTDITATTITFDAYDETGNALPEDQYTATITTPDGTLTFPFEIKSAQTGLFESIRDSLTGIADSITNLPTAIAALFWPPSQQTLDALDDAYDVFQDTFPFSILYALSALNTSWGHNGTTDSQAALRIPIEIHTELLDYSEIFEIESPLDETTAAMIETALAAVLWVAFIIWLTGFLPRFTA